jgi:hypothetical protein
LLILYQYASTIEGKSRGAILMAMIRTVNTEKLVALVVHLPVLE